MANRYIKELVAGYLAIASDPRAKPKEKAAALDRVRELTKRNRKPNAAGVSKLGAIS